MSKTILIVDDEEDVRAIAQLGLEMSTNWRILTASSGAEALNLAIQERLDLILLDLMMPDQDGKATLITLKANPITQSIPVIMVTAKEQQTLSPCFQELDLVTIIAKPFRPLTLAQQISQVLHWD